MNKDTKVVTFEQGAEKYQAIAIPQTFKLKILDSDGQIYSETTESSFLPVTAEVPKDTVYLKDSDGNIVGTVIPDTS